MQKGFYRIALFVAIIASAATLQAQKPLENHEGMWLPFKAAELNYTDMQALGFELPADKVYNEEAPSLEDAIVKLNGGSCTSEMVSGQGLMLTNHHCAYDAVATLSSEADDYLTDGFWAMNRGEELPIPGSTAGFLIHSEDVTAKVLGEDGVAAPEEIEAAIQEIVKEATTDNGYDAEVKEVFHGLEYQLFVYEIYRDVRLVGAPPSAIGKFGGDTDNWMWPRHTGDFAVLRVYAGSDNMPADYSADNKPYEPRHFLPISIKGVEENDYAMVMGYPGSTSRYLSAAAVDMALEQSNLDKMQLFGQTTSIMKEAMDQSDKIRIALASNYASLMNYYKYLIGQTTMMKRYDVVEEKRQEEKVFVNWANENEERAMAYGTVLQEIGELQANNKEVDRFMSYLNFSALAADASKNSYFQLNPFRRTLSTEGKPGLAEMVTGMKEGLDETFESYFYDVDKEIFKAAAISYYENIPADLHPAIFMEILADPIVAEVVEEVGKTLTKKEKRQLKKKKKEMANMPPPPPPRPAPKPLTPQEKISEWVDNAYAKAIFTDRARFEAFLNAPSMEALEADPILQYINEIVGIYRSKVGMSQLAFETQTDNLRKSYIAGMQEMHPDKEFYPDANSTMRLTYGTVRSYEPQDGMLFQHYTTLAGAMDKEDPNDAEFVVPAKLKSLFQAKDFGPYGKDGRLEINFLTTNDITGGNSGSPVINSKGELIGLAFDGNWEAMSSDIHVFPDLKRTICVDARYVLFVIDKFAGASHLIEEMTVISE